jgi:predicted dehydrogenase
MDSISRRAFVTTVGIAGAALAGRVALAEDKKITLALAGCAHIHTPMFLNMLTTRENVKVKFAWDHDAARAEKRAGDCGAKVAKDLNEILNDADVNAVLVLSETGRHPELVAAIAKAKKHVFVEKPLAASAKDAAEMADAIEKAGVRFSMGYNLRSVPQHIFIKDQIAKGNFGKIVRVHSSFANECVLQGAFDKDCQWTVDPKCGSQGAFADVGTHTVDLLMWMMGDVESVSADVSTLMNRYPDCNETGQALLRFKNGVTGSVNAGWIEPANPVSLLVSGTEGHAVMFNERMFVRSKKIEGADGARPWGKLPPGPEHPLLSFLDAVGGKADAPLVTPREAAARVKVMEAMLQSAKERKWVAV